MTSSKARIEKGLQGGESAGRLPPKNAIVAASIYREKRGKQEHLVPRGDETPTIDVRSFRGKGKEGKVR